MTNKPHTICAWCKAVLHEGDKKKPVSHGICEACDDRHFGNSRDYMDEPGNPNHCDDTDSVIRWMIRRIRGK
jgi:hypothetical protein